MIGIDSSIDYINSIHYYIEKEFKKFLEILLDRIIKNKEMTDMIKNSIDYNIDNILDDLDSKSTGNIEISSLSLYLNRKIKKKFSLSDVQILFNEIDCDKDGIISYEDIRTLLKLSERKIILPRRQKKLTYECETDISITSTIIERKSLLNIDINTRLHILRNYFDNILKTEKKVDQFKIELSECKDITLKNFLSLFRFYNGYLTFNDMKQFLISNKIYPHDEEIYLLIKRFDIDNDCNLNTDELLSIIVPIGKENSKSTDKLDESELSYTSKLKIRQLFRLLIENESEIKKMNKFSENERRDFFDLIKSQYREYIIPDDIKSFGFTDYDTLIIFHRMNKNKDNKIMIDEV